MDTGATWMHCPEPDSSTARPQPRAHSSGRERAGGCAVGVQGRAGTLSQLHIHAGGLLPPS